ncbi:hypothetical protein FG297_22890 [Vibrio alginolyticus]|uniref:hypothetical protein n=1 Tax=Vibrio diabolicus TaxID=50719 RepID=UPI00193D8BFA|nr:hypothetical protein [Vibrio diabolicus]EGQ8547886.1 hypothetical protein [Vibrio parahaemolyticus]EHA1078782.1 hypothetical protein [Vibrio alginolyticus]EGR3042407.1 hypothetical protein [Vibrio parahaemolyticus]EHA1137222.1 hypothetical protein [Vibrio alginolyticus]EJC6974825.1 hypothetical protein [Vibrio parahaemolyticus]
MNNTFCYDNWKQPTVKEVESIMGLAAKRLDCEVKDLYKHFDGDARTFRRWKENADKTPNAPSKIRYTAYGLLVALATDKLIFTHNGKPLKPKNAELWNFIEQHYIYKADEFVQPSPKVVTMFIGQKDSISGYQRQELARFLGYDKNHFGRVIGNMNFGVWTTLLICFGVPLNKVFDLAE